MGERILQLTNIVKSFGDTPVLRGISLDIEKGEFITLLGSSGCGKTTTLRIIAGLENPDSGRVFLEGQDVTDIQPNRRDVNTIFQNYALFPHMNIYNNVAYSLKLKKRPSDEIGKRVKDMLELVQLSGFEKRMPSELSGGQRQRVAIARALINNPSVLLLDEPLGALDLQLRRQMQQELKRLQKSLGTTFVYITHDQEEAINMSDRIVVMNNGNFEQIGTPAEIYDHPKTSFVATFIGTTNLFRGKVLSIADDMAEVELEGNGKAAIATAGYSLQVGSKITFSVRSENIRTSQLPKDQCYLPATVAENSYVGGMLRIVFLLKDGTEVFSTRQGVHGSVKLGEQVYLSFDSDSAALVDMEEE